MRKVRIIFHTVIPAILVISMAFHLNLFSLNTLANNKETKTTGLVNESINEKQSDNGLPGENDKKSSDIGFTTYAENNSLKLSVDEKQAIIRVTEKNSGKEWYSSPPDYENDKLAKGAVKMSMGSLLLIKYANRDTNITLQNCKVGSVNKNGVKTRHIENGVRFDFEFIKEGFVIPLEITLEKDYLKVRIPVKDIKETSGEYVLNTIIPLPYFGAAQIYEDGYSFVPDGCGAIIDHKNVNDGYEEYSQYIYDRDAAIAVTSNSNVIAPANLPVFGMKRSDNAFVGIIDQGSSRAKINASVGGSKMSYNTVYPEFIYRDCTIVDISKRTYEYIKLTMFEPGPTKIDGFVVRYCFLEGNQANYTGMALRYQKYLLDDKGVTKKAPANYAPLYIEFFGGVKRQGNFLGIPFYKNVAITTYGDVKDIVGQFLDKGIDDIVVNYINWTKGTSDNVIPIDLKTEAALGGETEFKKMLQYLKKNKVDIFLDVNITDMYASRSGFNKKFDSTKTVQKGPLIQYIYKYSTYQPDKTLPGWFLLTPSKVLQAVKGISKNAQKYAVTGYSANTLGQKIYSDFGDNHVDRGMSEDIWEKGISNLSSITGESLFKTPNAYVFPYATHITDVPVESSKHMIETQEVPFYQIAIHGILPITLPSINTFSNSKYLMLKALETGSNIKLLAGARNQDKVLGTSYEYLFDIDYKYWIDDTVKMYSKISGFLSSVSDKRIINHQIIQQGITETTYENGISAIVNYTDKDEEVRGVIVKANDYYISRR